MMRVHIESVHTPCFPVCESHNTGSSSTEASTHQVLIEGESHTYAIVVLLAWLLTLKEKARYLRVVWVLCC